MAIEKYMVDFTIVDEVALPENTPKADLPVIQTILRYCEHDQVQDVGYHFDHGEEIDNHCDDQPVIGQSETFVTIRFEAEEDSIIWDSEELATVESLFKAAVREAKNPVAHISNCWSCGETPLVRNTIEITTYNRE